MNFTRRHNELLQELLFLRKKMDEVSNRVKIIKNDHIREILHDFPRILFDINRIKNRIFELEKVKNSEFPNDFYMNEIFRDIKEIIFFNEYNIVHNIKDYGYKLSRF